MTAAPGRPRQSRAGAARDCLERSRARVIASGWRGGARRTRGDRWTSPMTPPPRRRRVDGDDVDRRGSSGRARPGARALGRGRRGRRRPPRRRSRPRPVERRGRRPPHPPRAQPARGRGAGAARGASCWRSSRTRSSTCCSSPSRCRWWPGCSRAPTGCRSRSIVIWLIVVANAVLGYVQEARAEQAVAALQRMAAATRRRRPRRRACAASRPTELVPGDVLVLGRGRRGRRRRPAGRGGAPSRWPRRR